MSLIQRNRFVYFKGNFFESTKLSQFKEIFSLTVYQRNVSLIQRNCFMSVPEFSETHN